MGATSCPAFKKAVSGHGVGLRGLNDVRFPRHYGPRINLKYVGNPEAVLAQVRLVAHTPHTPHWLRFQRQKMRRTELNGKTGLHVSKTAG